MKKKDAWYVPVIVLCVLIMMIIYTCFISNKGKYTYMEKNQQQKTVYNINVKGGKAVLTQIVKVKKESNEKESNEKKSNEKKSNEKKSNEKERYIEKERYTFKGKVKFGKSIENDSHKLLQEITFKIEEGEYEHKGETSQIEEGEYEHEIKGVLNKLSGQIEIDDKVYEDGMQFLQIVGGAYAIFGCVLGILEICLMRREKIKMG